MTQAEQIVVDLGRLRETWHSLKSDTEKDLGPGLAYTDSKIQHGLQFGTESPSAEVQAARLAFVHMLVRNHENFMSHVRRAEQVVAFMDLIMERYRDADDLLAAKTDHILAMFGEALPPSATQGSLP